MTDEKPIVEVEAASEVSLARRLSPAHPTSPRLPARAVPARLRPPPHPLPPHPPSPALTTSPLPHLTPSPRAPPQVSLAGVEAGRAESKITTMLAGDGHTLIQDGAGGAFAFSFARPPDRPSGPGRTD